MPAGKMVHVILDNYAAHKHPKVRAWLDRHALPLPLHPNLRLVTILTTSVFRLQRLDPNPAPRLSHVQLPLL